jgi:stage II sporulation protein P
MGDHKGVKEGRHLFAAPGIALVVLISGLVFFGFAQRVLDRMRLSDGTALLLLAIMFIGYYLPELPLFGTLRINPGGGLIPLGVALYLIITADTTKEKLRGVIASLLVAGAIYWTDKNLSLEPGGWILDTDPIYTGGIIAAIVAYIAGRSRRLAFASAILGLILVDLIAFWQAGLPFQDGPSFILGGGGLFDVLMVGGVTAVLIAEGIGELVERLVGRAQVPPMEEEMTALANALGVEDGEREGEGKND